MTMNPSTLGPVVSAAHLADGAMPALSEMEFAMILFTNAFQRWSVRCFAAAGVAGLAPIDVMVLHAANHREREKTLSDICLMYGIEDTHLVTYAVKKLAQMGLLKAGRRGKEKTVRVTDEGASACKRYREIREGLLISAVSDLQSDSGRLSAAATMIRALSGQYDQAARSAASL